MKYKDKTIFLFLLGVCFIGIAVGIIIAKRAQVDVSGITYAIEEIKSAELSIGMVFIKGLLSNLYLFIILAMAGLVVFGLPISIALLFYKGYAVGFTCACICMAMGFKGVLVAIAGVLIPSAVILSLLCYMVSNYMDDRGKSRINRSRVQKLRLINSIMYILIFVLSVGTQSVMQYVAFYKL